MSSKSSSSKTEIIRIDSVIEADAVLGRLAAETAKYQARSAKVNRAIETIRTRFDSELNESKGRMEALRCALEDWATVNRKEFGDKKSLDLLHGTISFRTSPPALKLLSKMTWDRVLARLTGAWDKYVRVKREVNKEALVADASRESDPLAEAALSRLGVKVVREEKFFVQIKDL